MKRWADELPGEDAIASAPILIVDDDTTQRLALKTILAPLGYTIVEAGSGEDALRCVTAADFAVILLDVRMPAMDGFETAARVRMRVQSELTPIIFITAHSDDEIPPPARYLDGAFDYMFAPVQPDELRAKVSFFVNVFLNAKVLANQARQADRLAMLTDVAPIGIFRTDTEGRYAYTNTRWTELTGIPAAEALGQTWEALCADERAGAITEFAQTGGDPSDLNRRFELRQPGVDPRIVLATWEPLLGRGGELVGRVGTLADVTAAEHEREADHARIVAEEQYRRIVETTMEGIWMVDAENRTTFVNEAMAAILATTVSDMRGRNLFEFHPDAQRELAEQGIARRRAGGSERLEMKLRRADGVEIHALLSTNSILDEDGTYVGALAMVRDVTESVIQAEHREGLEEQLRQSQRLESIGQLAGGVAHDFNNLLLGIRGFSELALGSIERGDDKSGEYVGDILEVVGRATDLTRQLLAFGRRQVLQPEVIDLSHVVRGMERLLGPLTRESVELLIVAPEAPVLVEADRTQLEQVIMNLAVNARDAMPGGGLITMTISVLDEPRNEAVLTVSDTGTGMDAETVARVFEPFFTTKGDAGTGLGLATVHGIVSQSGGRVGLESQPGVGSTFSISLPLSDGAQVSPATSLPDAEGGADTVLVIEDDSMVRVIVAAILENLGYQVLSADGGEAALRICDEWTSEIHLILTDLVMPGLSGRETAERIRGNFPAARVLYMSGYTDDVVIRGGALDPGTAFIQKPFGAADLARGVRNALKLELA